MRAVAGRMERPQQTDCSAEPPYPDHQTVVLSIRHPDWVCHPPSGRCALQLPHDIGACGEFDAGRPSRARHQPTRRAGCLRRTRWMMLGGYALRVPLDYAPKRRHLRYVYLGDTFTAPHLVGLECDPVRRPGDRKCIVSTPMATALVRFAVYGLQVVARRRLRLTRTYLANG